MVATTWSSTQKSAGITLSGGALTATITSGTSNAGATRPISGPTYGEFTVGASLTGTLAVGLMNLIFNLAGGTTLGADANSVGYRQNGAVVINGVTISTIATFAATNVICWAFHPARQLIWFRVGTAGNWNNNALNDPATFVGGISTATMTPGTFYPAMGGTTVTPNQSITAAFTTFAGTAPSGYVTTDTIQGLGVDGAVGKTASYTQPGAVHAHAIPAAAVNSSIPAARGSTIVRAWYGGNPIWSPAATATNVSGTVKEGSTPVAKTVRAYDSTSGVLLGSTTSNGTTGAFTIPALGRTAVDVVAKDPTSFQAEIYDRVVPV